MADDHPTTDPDEDEYGEVDTGRQAPPKLASGSRPGAKRSSTRETTTDGRGTRRTDPEDIDVRERDPDNSNRDEDNDGRFEVETDQLRVKPEEEE